MPYLSISITAATIAWYAAIVSTLSVAVSAYNEWKNRASVHITWQPRVLVVGDWEYKEGVQHLSIKVSNRGRRPLRIEQAHFLIYGQAGHTLLASSFSERRIKVIDEQTPTTTFLVPQDKIDVKNIYCIVIVDGAGRTYRKYLKSFPTFKKTWLRFSSKGKVLPATA